MENNRGSSLVVRRSSLKVVRSVCVSFFVVLLIIGFRLALQKSVWNDEIYSQITNIEGIPLIKMFNGSIREGNNAPLFYLSQKVILGITGYHSPAVWLDGTRMWGFDRPWDRFFMRIGPVACVSLMIVGIFYFFARFYSWGTAAFSLFLSLSTSMVWQYWAEARPYGLWMLLTTLQVLLFLHFIRNEADRARTVARLAGVHLLLSLTAILSLPQIIFISALLWVYGLRDVRRYLFLTLFPALFCLAYYFTAPQYPFGLIFTVDQYLRANISRDRLYIFLMFGVFLAIFFAQGKLNLKLISEKIREGLPAFYLGLGMIAGAGAVLALFKAREAKVMLFPVTEKYFIFLVPVGIIVSTVLVDTLIRSARSRWLSFLLMAGTAGLVVPRFVKVMKDILRQYPGLFS